MIRSAILSLGAIAFVASNASAFMPTARLSTTGRNTIDALKMGAESEVGFGDLDGSSLRIGIIRTRWNDEDVSNLVDGIKSGLAECKVPEDNIFIKEVPGAYELPFAAMLLAKSRTVDAVICAGVLIKGDTMHFEYIADAVSKGIMNVGLTTNVPAIFGVLTCMNEDQVKARSTGDSNHGVDWGKTAVEMALIRNEAMKSGGAGATPVTKADLSALGFASPNPEEKKEEKEKQEAKKAPGFF